MKTHHHLPTHPATRSSRRDFLALRTARRLLAVLGLLIAAAVAPTAIAANSPPTGITVNFANGGAFSLGVPGITIGTFVATDPDAGQTHTFTLVAGPGDTDNASFVITAPNTLKFAPTVSLETKNYSLLVHATDNGSPPASTDFTVTLRFAPVANTAPSFSLRSGVTWTPRPSAGFRTWFALASSADGLKLVAAEGHGKIFTSTDAGSTWTQRAAGGTDDRLWGSLASSANGQRLVAGALHGPIYTSADGGVT